MVKIGIVGIGFVGGAILRSFLEKNKKNNEIFPYDKFKNIGSFNDVVETDIVFLCLPTPYNHDICSFDKNAINEICEKLSSSNYKGLVIIKSTLEPLTCQTLADIYKLQIIHNPEFLSARTAFEDFHNQKHIIIGTTSSVNEEKINLITNFYKKNYPDAEISMCTSTESEAVKLFCNCFYAIKVQFFSELYLLCKKINMDYDIIKNIMLKNGWINPMHTKIPGIDGLLSYGGMCFPKDTNALLSFMKKNKTFHYVLEATINEHNIMRAD